MGFWFSSWQRVCSGTTGVPKGAVLTHANCVASIYSAACVGDSGSFARVDENDVYISYLPLAHVFERVAQGLHVFRGAAIGYYQVNRSEIQVYMQVLIIMHDYYRVIQQNYWMILLNWSQLCSALFLACSIVSMTRSWLVFVQRVVWAAFYSSELLILKRPTWIPLFITGFGIALSLVRYYKIGIRYIFVLLTYISSIQIRQKLGGRLRFILSGSAPVSPDVMDFMRICFSANVYEGYGQTENFCGGCLVRTL